MPKKTLKIQHCLQRLLISQKTGSKQTKSSSAFPFYSKTKKSACNIKQTEKRTQLVTFPLHRARRSAWRSLIRECVWWGCWLWLALTHVGPSPCHLTAPHDIHQQMKNKSKWRLNDCDLCCTNWRDLHTNLRGRNREGDRDREVFMH